jgi:urease accessory protein
MHTLALLRGLRFIDSFFPSGGYAFSSGLEAAVQDGAVQSAEGLSSYVEDLLRSMAQREAVAVGLAHRAAINETLRVALVADHELEAMKLSREARHASRQMGRQVIRIAAEREGQCILHDFLLAVESDRSPGHLAVSLGLTLGAFDWEKKEAIAGFFYQSAVGLVSAALKLIPMGQREGQRLLAKWSMPIAELSDWAASRVSMRSWSPVQDIYAMRHSRLESRLFRS